MRGALCTMGYMVLWVTFGVGWGCVIVAVALRHGVGIAWALPWAPDGPHCECAMDHSGIRHTRNELHEGLFGTRTSGYALGMCHLLG